MEVNFVAVLFKDRAAGTVGYSYVPFYEYSEAEAFCKAANLKSGYSLDKGWTVQGVSRPEDWI